MYPKFFATTNANKLREINEILGEELEPIEIKFFMPLMMVGFVIGGAISIVILIIGN